jgi:hypothetical protein
MGMFSVIPPLGGSGDTTAGSNLQEEQMVNKLFSPKENQLTPTSQSTQKK